MEFVGVDSSYDHYRTSNSLGRASVFVIIARVCRDKMLLQGRACWNETSRVLCRKLCVPQETCSALERLCARRRLCLKGPPCVVVAI